MSDRNIELLRRWFAALNARDLEAVIALCDPSGVFISTFAVGCVGSRVRCPPGQALATIFSVERGAKRGSR
jgi:hypothetical protein